MAGSRVAVLLLVAVVLLAATRLSEQRGQMKVDHVFASAGRVVSAERLNTNEAVVQEAAVDQVGFGAYGELRIQSDGLDIGGSFLDVRTQQSISLRSETADVGINAGGDIRAIELTDLSISSSSRSVSLSAPRGSVRTDARELFVDSGGVNVRSGLQGTTVAATGGDAQIASVKSDIVMRGGGSADLTAYTELEALARTGSITIKSTFERGTASLYGQERVIVDALRNLALTTTEDNADISLRAGDVLDLAAGATIAFALDSVDINSISDTVKVEAAQKLDVSSFTKLEIVGGEEGVQFKASGDGQLSLASGIGNIKLTGNNGGVDFSADGNINTTSTGSFTVESGKLEFGGSKVSLGSQADGNSLTMLNSSRSITWDAGVEIDVNVDSLIVEKGDAFVKMASGVFGTVLIDANDDIVWENGGTLAVYGNGEITGHSDSTKIFAGQAVLFRNDRGDGIGGGDITIESQNGTLTFKANLAEAKVTGGDARFTASGQVTIEANELTLASALDQESTMYVNALEWGLATRVQSGRKAAVTAGDSVFFDLNNDRGMAVEGISGTSTIESTDGGRVSFTSFRDMVFNATGSQGLRLAASQHIESTNDGLAAFGENIVELESTFGDVLFSTEALVAAHAAVDIEVNGDVTKLWTYANAGLTDSVQLVALGGEQTFSGTRFFVDSEQDTWMRTLSGLLTVQGTTLEISGGFEDSLFDAQDDIFFTLQRSTMLGEDVHLYSEDGLLSVHSGSFIDMTASVRGVRLFAEGDWVIKSERETEITIADNFESFFGGDGSINSLNEDVILDGAVGAQMTSVGGAVSLHAISDVLIDSGRDIFFRTADNINDTLAMATTFGDITVTGSTLLQGGVSDGRLDILGSTVSVDAGTDLSLAASLFGSVSDTFLSGAVGGDYNVQGGAISLFSQTGDIFVESLGDLTLRSNAEVNHHIVTAKVSDEMSFNAKQHLIQSAGRDALYEAAHILIEAHKFGKDDGFDGDVLMFAPDILVDSATSHDNDVRLFSGGAVSMNAGTGTANSLFSWSFDFDALIEAEDSVWFRGHTNGGFTAQAFGPGRMTTEATAGSVIFDYDGADFRVVASRDVFDGGASIVMEAADEVDFVSSTHIYFDAFGHRPNDNVFGSVLGERDAGMLVRSSDIAGNIAFEARDAYVRFDATAGSDVPLIRVESPALVSLLGYDGVQFDNERNTIVEAEDGAVQVQGDRGFQMDAQSHIAMEASRLLSIEIVDLLEVVAKNDISVLTEAGDIAIETQFFKDVQMEAEDLVMRAGASGIRIKSEDDHTYTAEDNVIVIGDRGVQVETLAGSLAIEANDVLLSAVDEITGSAGRDFVVSGTTTEIDSENTELTTLGGDIDFLSDTLNIVADSNAFLKSGLGSSPQSNADRTLLYGADSVSISSFDDVILVDASDTIRLGFESAPVVELTAEAGDVVFETTGNAFVDTDGSATFNASRITVEGGREGIEFSSVTDATVKTGTFQALVPESLFDVRGEQIVVFAEEALAVESGSSMLLESTSQVTGQISIVAANATFASLEDLEMSSPGIEYTSNTLTMTAAQKFDVESSQIDMSVLDARFGALGRSEYVVSGDFAAGIQLLPGPSSAVRIDTSERTSDIRFVTLDQFSWNAPTTTADDITLSSSAEIDIGAVKSDDRFSGSVSLTSFMDTEITAERLGVVSAADSLTVSSIQDDIAISSFVSVDFAAVGDISLSNDQVGQVLITGDRFDSSSAGATSFFTPLPLGVSASDTLGVQSDGDIEFTAGPEITFLSNLEQKFDSPYRDEQWVLGFLAEVLDPEGSLVVDSTVQALPLEALESVSFVAGASATPASLDVLSETFSLTAPAGSVLISADDRGDSASPLLDAPLESIEPNIFVTGPEVLLEAVTNVSLTSNTVKLDSPEIFLQAGTAIKFLAAEASIAVRANQVSVESVDIRIAADGPNLDPELGVPAMDISAGSAIIFESSVSDLAVYANQDLTVNADSITLAAPAQDALNIISYGGDSRASPSGSSVLFSAEGPGENELILDPGTLFQANANTQSGSISSTSETFLATSTTLDFFAADNFEISAHGLSRQTTCDQNTGICQAQGVAMEFLHSTITMSGSSLTISGGDDVSLSATTTISAAPAFLDISAEDHLHIYGTESTTISATVEDLGVNVVAGESVLFESASSGVSFASEDQVLFYAGVGNEEAEIRLATRGDIDLSALDTAVLAENDILSRSQSWAVLGDAVSIDAPEADVMFRVIDITTNAPSSALRVTGLDMEVYADAVSHRQHELLNLDGCDGGVPQQQAFSGRIGLYPADCTCTGSGQCNCPQQLHLAIDLFTALRNYGLLSPVIGSTP